MKKDQIIYSIVVVQDNHVDSIANYTSQIRATSHYKVLLQEKFPHLTRNEVKRAVDEGIIIDYNNNTYNLIKNRKRT
jgi:hypothetical protein